MGDRMGLRDLYEAGKLDEAGEEYARLLRAEPSRLGAQEHWFGAMTARRLGDYRETRRALERAEALSPAGRIKGQIIMTMGCLLREIGDTTAAIDHLQRFIAGLDEYPDLIPIAEGYCWYNLGLTFRCARRLPDAIGAYQRAIERFRSDDMPRMLCTTLHNLAWVYCLTGDAAASDEMLSEANNLSSTDEDRWNQRIGWAFLESISGQPHSALKRCEEIIEQADRAPASIVSHAFWVAGRVTLALGQPDEALVMADQAIAWSLRVKNDIRPMQDANELRREIYLKRMNQNSGA